MLRFTVCSFILFFFTLSEGIFFPYYPTGSLRPIGKYPASFPIEHPPTWAIFACPFLLGWADFTPVCSAWLKFSFLSLFCHAIVGSFYLLPQKRSPPSSSYTNFKKATSQLLRLCVALPSFTHPFPGHCLFSGAGLPLGHDPSLFFDVVAGIFFFNQEF